MGQQQLLLVILVTIIVGIATVVAINIFGTAAEQANRDAVRQDLFSAASQAQAIWARPTLMDGANRNFENLDADVLLRRLGIAGSEVTDEDGAGTGDFENENGTYSLTRSTNEIVVVATPASGGSDITLTVTHEGEDGWNVTITSPDDLN